MHPLAALLAQSAASVSAAMYYVHIVKYGDDPNERKRALIGLSVAAGIILGTMPYTAFM